MSIDIEEQLRVDADMIGRRLAGRPVPPTPAGQRHSALFVPVLAGVLLAAAAIVMFVVMVDGSKNLIKTTPPLETVAPQEVVPAVTDGSTPTSSQPLPSESSQTVPTVPAQPPIGVPIETVAVEGGPAAFGVLPEGYRVVMVNEDPSALPGLGSTWLANFIKRPTSADELAPYIQVQIDRIDGTDAYDTGFPGLDLTTDVTMGSFTGKLWTAAPGYQSLVVRLPNDYRLLIGGRADLADVEVLARGLSVSTDPVGAQASTLPAGFELVGQGFTTGSTGGGRWRVSYAREQLMSSLVTVSARVQPHSSALADLLMPSGGRVVDVDGHTGVISMLGLTFDVSPTYQIKVERETLVVAPGREEPALSDDELIALARLVVAVSADEFGTLALQAAEHPLAPTDNPCSFYITTADPRSDQQVSDDDGGIVVAAPGAFTIDLSTWQPLRNVTIGVRPMMLSTTTPLLTVDELVEPTTVTVFWDGTIDGQPAERGQYRVEIDADPLVAEPGLCSPDSSANSASIGVVFQVG